MRGIIQGSYGILEPISNIIRNAMNQMTMLPQMPDSKSDIVFLGQVQLHSDVDALANQKQRDR